MGRGSRRRGESRGLRAAHTRLSHLADQAFVDAMTTTATLAAGVALVGALIAAAFLPSRARNRAATIADEALPEPAAA
jgi:hypothetical protein